MKHELLFLGKIKDRFISDGVEEYTSRLRHYTSFSIITIKVKARQKGKKDFKDKEGQQLLQAVSPGSMVVALDSKGKQFSSETFAKKIMQWEMQGIKKISYLIGGPEGHSPGVLQAADMLLSLSKMTFTHDMTRLLLIEQLYRAYTIKAGEQYHK